MDVALWFHGEALSARQHLLAAAFPPDFVEPLAWPSTDVQDRSRDAFLLKRAPVLCWAQPFSLFVFAIGVLVEAFDMWEWFVFNRVCGKAFRTVRIYLYND